MRLASAVAALGSALVLAAGDAAAFERQQHAGVGAGLALVKAEEKSALMPGGAFAAHYAYGLSDSVSVLAEGGGALLAPSGGPRFCAHAGAGLAYVLDVLEWVPYAGVVAEGYALGGGTKAKLEGAAGAALALGLDWQTSRTFALGIAARQHFVVTRFAELPSFTTVLLRAELLWGW